MNMQCIYLLKSDQAQEGITGVVHYTTTEDDLHNYCESNNFLQCPRLMATIKAKKVNGMATAIEKNNS
jgi:hypothetical protein